MGKNPYDQEMENDSTVEESSNEESWTTVTQDDEEKQDEKQDKNVTWDDDGKATTAGTTQATKPPQQSSKDDEENDDNRKKPQPVGPIVGRLKNGTRSGVTKHLSRGQKLVTAKINHFEKFQAHQKAPNLFWIMVNDSPLPHVMHSMMKMPGKEEEFCFTNDGYWFEGELEKGTPAKAFQIDTAKLIGTKSIAVHPANTTFTEWKDRSRLLKRTDKEKVTISKIMPIPPQWASSATHESRHQVDAHRAVLKTHPTDKDRTQEITDVLHFMQAAATNTSEKKPTTSVIAVNAVQRETTPQKLAAMAPRHFHRLGIANISMDHVDAEATEDEESESEESEEETSDDETGPTKPKPPKPEDKRATRKKKST